MRRKITAALLAAVVALSMSVPAAFAADTTNTATGGDQNATQVGANVAVGDGNNQSVQQQQNQQQNVAAGDKSTTIGSTCASYHDNWSHGVLSFGYQY